MLLTDHAPEAAFEIVKAIELSDIDYENFIFGLDADREYIEENVHLCSDGAMKKCLLIRQNGNQGGILVIPGPEHTSFVGLAACVKEV